MSHRSHAFKSTHPAVLEAWKGIQAQSEHRHDVLDQIRAETGREIYTVRGWGDSRSLGLSCSYNEQPPAGWRWHESKPASGIIVPRAKGPGTAEAKAIMKRLWDSDPLPRKIMHDMFGAPEFIHAGLTSHSPAIVLFDDGPTLWIYYGDYEYEDVDREWDGGDFFVRVRQSEWHAAKETQDEEDARVEAAAAAAAAAGV